MRVTTQLFKEVCKQGKGIGIYSLKPYDIDEYVSLLAEALSEDYSELNELKFGSWHFALTEPLSLDFVTNYRYEITLDRLKSLKDIAQWVDHLHGKVWFNYNSLDHYSKQPQVPDPYSPLNFFKAIVALNRRGIL